MSTVRTGEDIKKIIAHTKYSNGEIAILELKELYPYYDEEVMIISTSNRVNIEITIPKKVYEILEEQIKNGKFKDVESNEEDTLMPSNLKSWKEI